MIIKIGPFTFSTEPVISSYEHKRARDALIAAGRNVAQFGDQKIKVLSDRVAELENELEQHNQISIDNVIKIAEITGAMPISRRLFI